MSVSLKTAKKIGLFSAICILIGSLIGIGIFFKNNTVFANNNNNAISVIISWVLASVISITTAYSFAEIGFNHRNGAGISGSADKMLGKKFGRFISFNNSFFYIAIFNVVIAIFSAESIVNIFYPDSEIKIHMGLIMLIGLALLVIFVVFNYLSLKWSSRFQVLTTMLKFFPLIVIGLAGIIYGSMNPDSSLFSNNSHDTTRSLSINGILSSIPAILFAYDSFLGVASLQGEMDNPRKKVPLAIVIGMGICILLYLFITIGQIMVGKGSAYEVFNFIFQNKNLVIRKTITIIISIFILISVLGVLNSFSLIGLRTFQYAIKYRIIYGYWWFNKFNPSDKKIGIIMSFIVYAIWWIILFIPSTILNIDGFIDGFSNFPTLFMFAIYGTIVLKGFINRFKKNIHTIKMPGFIIAAPIAVIGCYLAFGYQFFYYYGINAFINPNQNINWGLFVTGSYSIKAYMGSICFISMILIFICAPFINDALLKLRYKKIQKNTSINSYNTLAKELLV